MNLLEKRILKTRTSLARLPGKWASLNHRVKSLYSGKPAPTMAFHVIGGLGDHILSARFIRDFVNQAGPVNFDIYTKRPGLAEWVFADIPGLSNVLHASADIKFMRNQYAMLIDAIGYLAIRHANLPKLQQIGNEALLKLHEDIKAQKPQLKKFIEHHPNLDGYLGHYVAMQGLKRHNFLHHMAGIEYVGDGMSLHTDETALHTFGLSGTKYITISNGYDDQTTIAPGQVVTKVYPHHGEVASILKRYFPGLKIVQIGAATSTPIDAADMNLIGKTSLKQAAAIIKGAALHIDNEGGLVHLARALDTPCCVVFGPTSLNYFGYDSNLNIAPMQCGGCWWMDGRWMVKCIQGAPQPPCMFSQNPRDVAQKIYQVFAPVLVADWPAPLKVRFA
jgi:hypothetical protein